MTQEAVALKLDISRPTYIQIEKGERELTISEAKKIAAIFNIPFKNFLNCREPNIEVKLKKEGGNKTKKGNEKIRISVPQKNIEKFKEVLLYILSKISAKPNVGESVIEKILYFIDFDFYEKFEEQLVGATYIKNHYGPTPVEFKAIVKEMIKDEEILEIKSKYFNFEQKKYLPLRQPDLTKLKDARELKHIDETLSKLGEKNAAELTEYSHEDVPWIITEKNKPIDYEAVFYRTPKTSARNYD